MQIKQTGDVYKMRLFSTEQVSKYHPDKYADQISDAVLEACLEQDKDSRVACECMVKGDMVVLCGEITTKAKVDYAEVARMVGERLGYKVSTVIQNICTQSPEIAGGVKSGVEMGAGDQGIMFGYACNDTETLLPYGFDKANEIIACIEKDVEEKDVLIGDAKCQVTVDLDKPHDVSSLVEILISVCHKDGMLLEEVKEYILKLLRENEIETGNAKITINPAGTWSVGGPVSDCGLTGRKIVCDQYGGYCAVGGGAFSGKDPSKVDRSAAYMARFIACDLLYLYKLEYCEVQLGYAIGKAEPMSVVVTTNDHKLDKFLSDYVKRTYSLTPYGIINYLDLLDVKYSELSAGCHFRKKFLKDYIEK